MRNNKGVDMRSMYSYIMNRVEQLAVSDVKDKAIRLHEYQYLLETAVKYGDLEDIDLQYVNELIRNTTDKH